MERNLSFKRKFNSGRVYKLLKWIVILVRTISLILAIFSYFDVFVNNSTLNGWKNYCKVYPVNSNDYSQCMTIGYNQKSDITEMMFLEFYVGILLPIIFFGGVGIFRYLFPIAQENSHK